MRALLHHTQTTKLNIPHVFELTVTLKEETPRVCEVIRRQSKCAMAFQDKILACNLRHYCFNKLYYYSRVDYRFEHTLGTNIISLSNGFKHKDLQILLLNQIIPQNTKNPS